MQSPPSPHLVLASALPTVSTELTGGDITELWNNTKIQWGADCGTLHAGFQDGCIIYNLTSLLGVVTGKTGHTNDQTYKWYRVYIPDLSWLPSRTIVCSQEYVSFRLEYAENKFGRENKQTFLSQKMLRNLCALWKQLGFSTVSSSPTFFSFALLWYCPQCKIFFANRPLQAFLLSPFFKPPPLLFCFARAVHVDAPIMCRFVTDDHFTLKNRLCNEFHIKWNWRHVRTNALSSMSDVSALHFALQLLSFSISTLVRFPSQYSKQDQTRSYSFWTIHSVLC